MTTMITEVYDALVEAGAGRYPPRWAGVSAPADEKPRR
jgi:hypothetical protein